MMKLSRQESRNVAGNNLGAEGCNLMGRQSDLAHLWMAAKKKKLTHPHPRLAQAGNILQK